MSASATAPIHGRGGDLVSLRITTDAKHLEDLLETLSGATFPINPQLWHRAGSVVVEFPAWETDVAELKRLLARDGFDGSGLRVCPVLATFETSV